LEAIMTGIVQALAGLFALTLSVVGVLEITQYRNPRLYSIFVIEPKDYDAVRMWAVNVGAYNLTFAAGIALGLILLNGGYLSEGRALVLFLVGAHLVLGLVLLASEPRLWRSALGQAGLPAVVLGLQLLS
jgi:putative membrane protein